MGRVEHIGACFTGATQEEVWPLVRDFHYSGRMPANVQHVYVARSRGGLFGDYGDEIFAAVLFSIPPARWSAPVLELIRLVRRPDYSIPLTKLIAFSCKQLKKQGYDLLVSYADSGEDHHGGIYQASSWNYSGKKSRGYDGLIVNGVFKPGRSCNSVWGTRSPAKLQQLMPHASIEPRLDAGKHLYWRALTKTGKSRARNLDLLTMPYPKPDLAIPAKQVAMDLSWCGGDG